MTMLTMVLLMPLVALNLLTEIITYNQAANLLEQITISKASSYEKEYKPEPRQNDPNIQDDPGDPDESDTPPEEKEVATGAQTAPEKKNSTTVKKIVEKIAETVHESNQANAPVDVPETQIEPDVDADAAPKQTDVVDTPVVTQQQMKPASTHAPEETKAAATTRATVPVTQDVQTDAPPQTQQTKSTVRKTEVCQTKSTQDAPNNQNPEQK